MHASTLSRRASLVSWACQLTAAAILAQTLFFKFTGAEESRYIFSTLGVEPWGRIAAGVAELVAALLLVYPRTIALGALATLGVISGALASHVLILGLEVQGDGGLLFALACATFAAAATVLWLRRGSLPVLGQRLAGA